MGTMTASSLSREASNYDEVSMQQSLLFSDSLKDLKNLRSQLYSAAEYFELSYTNDDQKQIVVETLKDYAIKALVNTVDHLGSVTYKVNDLLDDKVDEVSGTEFRVCCIEQRLRTCQEYIDHEGISQQSLVIDTPKYHKRYILPVGETMHGAIRTKSKYQGCSLDDEDDWHQFRNAVRATIREAPSSARETPTSSARETPTSLVNSMRKGRSPSPSPRPPPQRSATFSFTSTMPKKDLDKRSISPHRFPLLRSGSVSSRSTTPNTSRVEVDDDKENVRPVVKARVDLFGVKDKEESKGSSFRQSPLSEIDISSFRRPDLNSGSLFDPNLLSAFEEAVKEHMRVGEEERRARIEKENLERMREEPEKNFENQEEEPPLKARRIEEGDDIDPILGFPEMCPPGGSDSVILYTTSLRGIRKTFEDCNSIRFLLESFRVLFFERDVSMHMEFKEELWTVLDGRVNPPRLFIKGRYIGGAEEVLALHEQGRFRVLFEGIPIDIFIGSPCEGCAGFRFVLCFHCNGSHKVVAENGLSSTCQDCNENGLIICPLCC